VENGDDKAKRPTEYDLIKQARENAIDNAAKMLIGYSKVKAAAPKGAGLRAYTSGETVGHATDALYELMQLQFAFGNRVANLRGEQSVLAMQALERWYGALTPDKGCEESELEFSGAKGKVEQQFTIENRLGSAVSDVTVEWTDLRGPRPSRSIRDAIKLVVHEGNRKPVTFKESPCEHRIAMGRTYIVKVIIDLDKWDRPGTYRGELRVCMNRDTRRIALVATRSPEPKNDGAP